MCAGPGANHGTPSGFWKNMQQPMPLGEKLRLMVSNLWLRARKGDVCCGHAGQPGC
jgi:hypothetical protein